MKQHVRGSVTAATITAVAFTFVICLLGNEHPIHALNLNHHHHHDGTRQFGISSLQSQGSIGDHRPSSSSLSSSSRPAFMETVRNTVASSILGLTLMFTPVLNNDVFMPWQEAQATDGAAIAKCLFKKCPVALGKCIANPNCLANVICINTCNGRPDEEECQIECG